MNPIALRALYGRKAATSNAWNAWIASLSPNLWLKTNETSGTTAVDSSGNGLDGTYGDNYLLGQAPLFTNLGASVKYFDVVTPIGDIQVPNNALLNITGDFTIFSPLQINNVEPTFFTKVYWKITDYANGKGNYLLIVDAASTTLRGRVNSGGNYYDAVAPFQLTIGTDYVVGLRRLATELSLWIGAAGGSFSKAATATLPGGALLDTSANPLNLYNVPTSLLDGFHGSGNQFVLIARGLSDGEMATSFAKATA